MFLNWWPIDRKLRRLQPGLTWVCHGVFLVAHPPPTPTNQLPHCHTTMLRRMAAQHLEKLPVASGGGKEMRSVGACVKMTTSQFCFRQLFSEHSYSTALLKAHWSKGQEAGWTSPSCSTKYKSDQQNRQTLLYLTLCYKKQISHRNLLENLRWWPKAKAYIANPLDTWMLCRC